MERKSTVKVFRCKAVLTFNVGFCARSANQQTNLIQPAVKKDVYEKEPYPKKKK